MTIPSSEVRTLLNNLFQGHVTESERIIASLKSRYPEDMRYVQALEGILHSYVNDDHDSLIFAIYSRKELWKRRAEIAKYMEGLANRSESEDGYYRAWADVLGLLGRVPKPHKLAEKVEEENPGD